MQALSISCCFMVILGVPHYRQLGQSGCQAACAAMMIDYQNREIRRADEARLTTLLKDFSFRFKPKNGEDAPAITGLVAHTLGKMGFTVSFYSRNPSGDGITGLQFLKSRP